MALINEGNTSYVPWEMTEEGKNFFDKRYENDPLFKLGLLDHRQFVPFYRDEDITEDEMSENYSSLGGYTYYDDENIYISGLDQAGQQALKPAPFEFDPTSGASAHVQKLIYDDKYNRAQETFGKKSEDLAQIGAHESWHSNVFDPFRGAYKRAIPEMLRGTSALGTGDIWGSSIRESGKIYSPHLEHPTTLYKRGPSSFHEQNELFTQQLTNMIYPNHPYIDNASNAISSRDWMMYRDMDRPGQGPLGQEGLERLLRERSEPFYNQVLSDADVGYIQPSIWSGISEPLSSKSAIPTPSRSILSSEENIDINNQRQNELDKRAALVNQFAQIERGRHAVAIEDPIDYKMNADNSATMPYTHYNSKAANYAANVRPEYYFK